MDARASLALAAALLVACSADATNGVPAATPDASVSADAAGEAGAFDATTGAGDGGGDGGVGDAPVPIDAGPKLPALCSGRKLVFFDGFDGTALDTTKWNTAYPWGGSGCCTLGGNAEEEWYTPDQVTVQGGALHLVGVPKPTNGMPYASGMISSGPTQSSPLKFDFQYGYYEARVKIPAGQGLWPAFWTGNGDLSWPPEMDVMEILGNHPDTWYGTVHYLDPAGTHQSDGTSWVGPDFSKDWHSFGIDWQPGKLVWYVDGVAQKTVTAASEVQSKRAYLMANLAVGGSWPGNPDNTTPFPADYQVDYILVCQ
jgi:beta-glucanase (GH16 family)